MPARDPILPAMLGWVRLTWLPVDLKCIPADLVDQRGREEPVTEQPRPPRQSYRALIVEDDPRAADALRSYLGRFGCEVGASFSVEVLGSALELLDGHHVADIVFFDIGLPGINGMEAAEILRQTDEVTPIVFVTDLAQYAVRGYAVDALDFMVKPVSYSDFALRMGRAMRVMARNASSVVRVSTPTGLRLVRERDIVYVEVLRHDLYWHVAGEVEPLRMRGSLTAEEERLDPARFCRISASHLINMGHVSRVRGTSVTMDDGEVLTISRSKRKDALETLARFAGGSI